MTGGSAPTLPFSRPARRLLALRPACSLSRHATLCHRSVSVKIVASSHRSDCFRLERPFAGWDLHPLEIAVFARHTVRSRLESVSRKSIFSPTRSDDSADSLGLRRSVLCIAVHLFTVRFQLGQLGHYVPIASTCERDTESPHILF